MTKYTLTKYRFVEIVTAENEAGSYCTVPDIHDRHGHPYTCNTLIQAKQMISRVFRGKSTSYHFSR